MKKTITIICDIDIPVIHLFNNERFEVFETKENLYTMIAKEMPEGFNQENPK